MANSLDMIYFCLFPIGNGNRLTKKALSCCFGLIVDGMFQGVCTLRDVLRKLQALESEGYIVSSIHIHPLLRLKLGAVVWLLKSISDVPISVFLHDYYLCCESYNLINSNGSYCGGNGLSSIMCSRCAHYRNSVRLEKAIWGLFSSVMDRIQYVCPSETVREIFLRLHPKCESRCAVVPHQVFQGSYTGNLEEVSSSEKIRVAYLGSQMTIKGWDIWIELVARYKNRYDFLILNNQSDPRLRGVRRVFVEYSAEQPDAMVDSLRNERVDIAVMWSSVPETYSYTCMEAFASNVYIVTGRDSGNIADFVSSHDAGIVLSDAQDLFDLFQHPNDLLHQLNTFKSSHPGGPMELLDNNALIVGSSVERNGRNLVDAVICKDRLIEMFFNPLRIALSVRERKKIAASNYK